MVTIRAVLLRSPVALGGVLITVIATVLALTRHTIGFNLWADRVNGLTSASILIGVVAAGIAATEAKRWEHSMRVRLRTAARPRLLVQGHHAGAVLLPLFAGYWVAAVIVAVQAGVVHAYGQPPLVWLLSLGCAVLFAGAAGYVLGAVLPYRWYVGPVVGLAFYACYVVFLIAKLPYGVLSLFPASSNYYSVFTRVVFETLAAEGVFFTAAAFLVLVLLAVRGKKSARAMCVLAAAVVVTATAGGVVISANGQVTSGHNPRDFSCVGEQPVLCLNTGYARAGKALQREFHRLDERAAGTPLAATRLEQNVEGVGDDPSKGARSVYLEQWAARDDLTFSVFRYVLKYGGSQQCQNAQSAEGASLENDVNSWLSGYYESTAGANEDAISRRLAQLSESEGAAWFQKNYSAYASCTLTASDLP